MRLYIIGNGFDIYHNINSKYSDFKEYVENNDSQLFAALDNYFNSDELWSDFEETLAYIDTDTILDEASNDLLSYADDEWSDAYNHNYQYDIQTAVDIVTVHLRNHFTNWILQVQIPFNPKLTLDKESKYFTFNYTNTLASNYRIDPQNILYIHNKAIDDNSLLILGHSRIPIEDELFITNNDEDTDVRVAEGNEILDKYFADTYKNTDTIIRENHDYFTKLNDVTEIFVLGHSISKVDIKYFEEINLHVHPNTNWTVSYRCIEQREENRAKILSLGVAENRITMITFDELM